SLIDHVAYLRGVEENRLAGQHLEVDLLHRPIDGIRDKQLLGRRSRRVALARRPATVGRDERRDGQSQPIQVRAERPRVHDVVRGWGEQTSASRQWPPTLKARGGNYSGPPLLAKPQSR